MASLQADLGHITQAHDGSLATGDDQFLQIRDIIDLGLGIGVIEHVVAGSLPRRGLVVVGLQDIHDLGGGEVISRHPLRIQPDAQRKVDTTIEVHFRDPIDGKELWLNNPLQIVVDL